MLRTADHIVERAARRVTRRGLIGGAGSAALGAAFGVAHTSRAVASEAAIPPTAVSYDPNFVMGQVAAVSSDGALSVLEGDGRQRTARLLPSTRYWRASRWNVGEIVRGDCVTGRGVRNAQGELEFDVVWANIGRFIGRATSLTRAGAELALDDGRSIPVAFTDETVFRDLAGRESFGESSILTLGQLLFVISYVEPATGQETAHRVEIAGPSPADTIDEVVEVINDTIPDMTMPDGSNSPDFDVARRGNASYFCCGSQACGSRCGSVGSNGKCGFCSSSGHYIAWPKVSDCTAGCVDCCLQSDFPRYGCGTGFEVENACSGKVIFVQIADCGPNPRCRNTGCKGYDSVRFDLTPCAFTALGGSLDIGHVNLWVSSPA